MKLQDHHNEFAVKCFAEYMQPSEVAHAFMLEFENDLPQPPPPPEPPNYEEEIAGVEYQLSKSEYVKNKMDEIKTRYYNTYGIDSHIQREKDEAYYIEKFGMDFDKEWKKQREKMYEEQLTEYQ